MYWFCSSSKWSLCFYAPIVCRKHACTYVRQKIQELIQLNNTRARGDGHVHESRYDAHHHKMNHPHCASFQSTQEDLYSATHALEITPSMTSPVVHETWVDRSHLRRVDISSSTLMDRFELTRWTLCMPLHKRDG
ncbi:hypothetical protein BDR05DRAFT_647047 [Suillus weaverae]|nr:hypothetical protein BDR05DRAFT_647047 [Suillus weaverae]